LVILACAVVVALGQPLAGVAGDDPQPVDNSHNVLGAPAPVPDGVFGTSPPVKTGTAICTTTRQTGANANTDCAEPSKGPHNETSIAVNPTNPLNMLGGANDYQLALNPGGQVSETVLSRAHVTFDGGQTWSMYPVNSSSTYRPLAIRRWHSTPPATPTTPPSASASSVRPTPRILTFSSPTPATEARPGPR